MSKLLMLKLLILSSIVSPAIAMEAAAKRISVVEIGPTVLTSKDVVEIHLDNVPGPGSMVHLVIGEKAQRSISKYTSENVGKNIDISVDGRRVMSMPIWQPLEGRNLLISCSDDDAFEIKRSLTSADTRKVR